MLARRIRQSSDRVSSSFQGHRSESRASRGRATSHRTSWEEEDAQPRLEKNTSPHSRPRSGSESISRTRSSVVTSAMSHSQSSHQDASADSRMSAAASGRRVYYYIIFVDFSPGITDARPRH